jgi:hypothetical protein
MNLTLRPAHPSTSTTRFCRSDMSSNEMESVMRSERLRLETCSKLGTNHPTCTFCPEDHWRAFDPVRQSLVADAALICVYCDVMREAKSFDPILATKRMGLLRRHAMGKPRCAVCQRSFWRCLELHHLAGRSSGAEQIILCVSCHRKYDPLWGDPRTGVERTTDLTHDVRLLRGIAAILIARANELDEDRRL